MKEQAKKTIQMIKEQAREEDPKLTPALTLRTILGGDFLTADMVRRQIWLFVLMVVFTVVYVAFQISVPAGSDSHRQVGERGARRQVQGPLVFEYADGEMP